MLVEHKVGQHCRRVCVIGGGETVGGGCGCGSVWKSAGGQVKVGGVRLQARTGRNVVFTSGCQAHRCSALTLLGTIAWASGIAHYKSWHIPPPAAPPSQPHPCPCPPACATPTAAPAPRPEHARSKVSASARWGQLQRSQPEQLACWHTQPNVSLAGLRLDQLSASMCARVSPPPPLPPIRPPPPPPEHRSCKEGP
jgi:hypothetical protein